MALNEIAIKLAAFYHKLEEQKLSQERFYIKARLEEKINKIEAAIIPLLSQDEQSEKEQQCIAEIKQGIKNLRGLADKLEEKFSIFVIGDGNVGKSTVVNTLLGQEIAKMKFDPMTWKIDVFHDQPQKGVQIVTYAPRSNRVATLSIEDAKTLIADEETKRDESIHKIQECIKEKTETIHKVCKAQGIPYREVADKLEAYKERLWQEELYISDIIEVKWPVEANDLLSNFQIVDTPGLRQNRMTSHLQESIKKYYDEADGIIWVLDMNKIAMNSTKAYIEEIEEALLTKGKACDGKRMLALLNRSDCIRTEEEKQAILEQAHSMYKEEFQGILPFSATMALQGRLEEDEDLLEQSGYNELQSYIQSQFLLGANEVKVSKTLREIQREEIKFQVVISYYVQEIEERLKEYIEKNKALSEAFKTIEKQSLQRLLDMMTSYEHTVESHIEKYTEILFEVKEDKVTLLREEILGITKYEQDIKELLELTLKEVERIKVDYMTKAEINQLSEYPLQDIIEELDMMQYFKALEEELELEKVEEDLIRKLVSGIQVVKKMVDKPHIQQCKEKLSEGLKQVVEAMKQQLTDKLEISLRQEKQQILEIRQRQFNAMHGDEHNRINRLYALKTIDKLLSEPARESKITDYIKGMGESKWNNISTN